MALSKIQPASMDLTANYAFTGTNSIPSASSGTYEEKKLDRTNMLEHYGKIRAFHPRELLNLFGFPQSFSFPDSMTFRYQYQLIGNSVNVTVVAALLRELLVPKSG